MNDSVTPPLRLKKVRSLQGFSSRVLGVAMVATLVPTLALAITFVGSHEPASVQTRLLILLAVVVAVAVFTFREIRNVLRPVEALTEFVDHFVTTGTIEDVPESMDGELDGLIRNTRNAIVKLDLANRELAVVSRLDLLTGLPNRGVSTQRLEHDLARASRSGTPVTLVTIDIDDFKGLNDQFGIAVGDACLRYVADLSRTCIRGGDWMARWGADEFLILLWDTELEGASEVINRIRMKLDESPEAQDAGVRLTASFGSASLVQGERAYELVARAEGALHRAKRFGRHQSAHSVNPKS